ncbi:MAG: hypothetical protein Q4A60_06410 [Pasteurellaceae bacterium]|nr:hypothetical protein [Pasteurellaceae bacterium]
MAYQTGTAQNISDLFNKLNTFASELGWHSVQKTESRLFLTSPARKYWALEYKDRMLFTLCCTGFDTQRDAFNQPGSSALRENAYKTIKTATTHLDKGNYVSYDFFGTARYLHVVVEIEAGKFRHFGVGELQKSMTFTGGEYAYGTCISSGYDEPSQNGNHVFGFSTGYDSYGPVVRADDIGTVNQTPFYFGAYGVSSYSQDRNATGKFVLTLGRGLFYNDINTAHPDQVLLRHSASKFGQSIIPQPHTLIAHCGDGIFRRLGILEDRYECDMSLLIPRQVIEVNGERWMVIPSAQFDIRNQTRIEEGKNNSGIQGVCYRIVE